MEAYLALINTKILSAVVSLVYISSRKNQTLLQYWIYILVEYYCMFAGISNLGEFKECPRGVYKYIYSVIDVQKMATFTHTLTHTPHSQHTISTHGYSLSWPLNAMVPRLQQARFIWNNWDMYRRPQREVLLEFEQACLALSSRLENKETFFDCG